MGFAPAPRDRRDIGRSPYSSLARSTTFFAGLLHRSPTSRYLSGNGSPNRAALKKVGNAAVARAAFNNPSRTISSNRMGSLTGEESWEVNAPLAHKHRRDKAGMFYEKRCMIKRSSPFCPFLVQKANMSG